ncbi:MAG: DUF3644 domain-containing protein [Alphaproteobacteria bacterium]|nr:DUF3644 domain-containing protein [Alphaproteobacteria bacterium]MBQ9234883.1 DUF3644 domain-containing protein [Alphaproteobacteria bacterium]
MLQNIKPNRKKSKAGGLTLEEKRLVKGLLKKGYIPQDIVHIVNQGRLQTTNLGRISEISKDNTILEAPDEEVNKYLVIQSSYDSKTLLNPYKDCRLIRSREAMMAAVEIFNNPNMFFRIEMFCVLSNIAWTYLFQEKLERTKLGSSKRHNGDSKSLNEMLRSADCPISNKAVCENINKIIDIRDKVEHVLFSGGDEKFGALFQSNCLNFDHYLTEWFGENLTLSNNLSLALQFVGLQKEQIVDMDLSTWPKEIKAIYNGIETNEFADNNAFKIKVYYGTEITSKTKSDITQLIDYSTTPNVSQTVIKKVRIDKLSDYPLSYTQVAKQIKIKNDKITTNDINKIISEKNIKKNAEYSYINFRNKKQEEKYEKDKNIPKGVPVIYKESVIDYIISVYNEK